MTATTAAEPLSAKAAIPVAAPRGRAQRRRISPLAGRALEKLSHAIEYLTDEYMYAGRSFSAHDPQLEAVRLMMAMNREIYFSCPVAPSPAERFRSWLHS